MKLPLEYHGSEPEPGSPPSFKMLVDWCSWAGAAEALEADDELPGRIVTGQEAILIAMHLPPHLALQRLTPGYLYDGGWFVIDVTKLLTRHSRPAERAVA